MKQRSSLAVSRANVTIVASMATKVMNVVRVNHRSVVVVPMSSGTTTSSWMEVAQQVTLFAIIAKKPVIGKVNVQYLRPNMALVKDDLIRAAAVVVDVLVVAEVAAVVVEETIAPN
jgi:hypothetical protein